MSTRLLSRMFQAALPVGLVFASVGCSTSSVQPELYGVAPDEAPTAIAWQHAIHKAEEEKKFDQLKGVFIKSDTPLRELVTEEAAKNTLAKAQSSADNIPIDAYEDLVPEAARWLVDTLPASPAGSGPTKNVLIIKNVTNMLGGDSENNTALAYAFSQLKNTMLKSDTMRQNFVFLSEDEAAGQEAIDQATNGQPIALFDPTGVGNGETAAYPPEKIYIVKSTFTKLQSISNEAPAQSNIRFTLQVVLEKPILRRDFIAETFSQKYFLHPYRFTWITETKNDQLKAKLDEAKLAAESARAGGGS